jgi:hypothetical protein
MAMQRPIGATQPDVRSVMVERAGQHHRDALETLVEVLGEERVTGELVERERLPALRRLTARSDGPRKLKRHDLGDAYGGVGVHCGEWAAHAQRDQRSSERVVQGQRCHECGACDPPVGKGHGSAQLDRHAGARNFLDRTADCRLCRRVVGQVVRGKHVRAPRCDECQAVVQGERCQGGEPHVPGFRVGRSTTRR